MKEQIIIESIPSIIWGKPSNNVYIFVHGNNSQKEEAESFADIAIKKGYQVISFDLPEHGERRDNTYKCTVQNGVYDLKIIGKFARDHWKKISLYACSIGSYFSMLAYKDLPLSNCLFLSPILDMEIFIKNIMKWSKVDEDMLKERQEIPTSFGETLSWEYYSYVKAHPVRKWTTPTYILYGTNDKLTERDTVDKFINRFKCSLEVFPGGDHYFHSKEQLEILMKWIERNI
jgi:hypothetical protein